jgi:hypothetical protein
VGWGAASIRLLLLLVLALHAVENPPGPDALRAACRPQTLLLRFRKKTPGQTCAFLLKQLKLKKKGVQQRECRRSVQLGRHVCERPRCCAGQSRGHPMVPPRRRAGACTRHRRLEGIGRVTGGTRHCRLQTKGTRLCRRRRYFFKCAQLRNTRETPAFL